MCSFFGCLRSECFCIFSRAYFSIRTGSMVLEYTTASSVYSCNHGTREYCRVLEYRYVPRYVLEYSSTYVSTCMWRYSSTVFSEGRSRLSGVADSGLQRTSARRTTDGGIHMHATAQHTTTRQRKACCCMGAKASKQRDREKKTAVWQRACSVTVLLYGGEHQPARGPHIHANL